MYSSVWNCVISYLEAGFARWKQLAAYTVSLNNATHVNLHLRIQAIVHNQAVGHSYAMRLHGMAGNICIVANIRIVEVGDLLGLRASPIEGVGRSCRRGIGVIHGGRTSGWATPRSRSCNLCMGSFWLARNRFLRRMAWRNPATRIKDTCRCRGSGQGEDADHGGKDGGRSYLLARAPVPARDPCPASAKLRTGRACRLHLRQVAAA